MKNKNPYTTYGILGVILFATIIWIATTKLNYGRDESNMNGDINIPSSSSSQSQRKLISSKQADKQAQSSKQIVYKYATGRLSVVTKRKTKVVDLEKESPEDLAEYIQQAQNVHEVDCSKTQRVGAKVDGGWDLCLVGPYQPRNPCIAITFGIDNKWLFDEELAKNFHCKVHAFDPTINAKPGKHSENVWYYKLGLSDRKGEIPQVGPVDTLANIIEMVGAKDQDIDIVKMDIEGSEYPALKQAIKDGVLSKVRQLMIEFHTSSLKPTLQEGKDNQEVLKGLWDLGFRVWKYDWNIYNIRKSAYGTGVYRTTCNEVYMININYAKEGQT